MRIVSVVVLSALIVLGVSCVADSLDNDVGGVYLKLPGDGFESNEVQQELTQIDIPGPPATDFQLPSGVTGVASVADQDGGFAARVQFSRNASSADIAAFIARAEGRLGSDSVLRLQPGAKWPDCADVRSDCQRVDG